MNRAEPGDRRASAAVWATTALFAATFGTLILRQHDAYATQTFDFGIFDQGLWLLSRLRDPFVTLRGLPLFADHSSYVMVPLAPLYWLWDDPRALLLLTVGLLAAVGPLALAAGRALGLPPVLSAAVAISALAHPALGWATWWTFHPELVAIPLLLAAFLLALRGRARGTLLVLVVVLSVKEDAALVVAPLGLWMALSDQIRGPTATAVRRAGMVAAALSVVWFVVDVGFVLPSLSPTGELVYTGRYAAFGDGLAGALWGMLSDPVRVLDVLLADDRPWYLLQMLGPLAICLLRPSLLVVALPVTLANLLSGQAGQHDIRFQYSAYLSAIVVAAAVLGAKRAVALAGGRAAPVAMVSVAVVAAAVAANVAWSPSPVGRHAEEWITDSGSDQVVADALARIPAGDVVSAGAFLTPHLAHRPVVYLYPNPFSRSYWAVDGVALPPTDEVEWVVVRPGDVAGDEAKATYEGLRAGGEWEVVVDDPTVVLLHRQP